MPEPATSRTLGQSGGPSTDPDRPPTIEELYRSSVEGRDTLSPVGIGTVAWMVGFRDPVRLRWAIATALAESRGVVASENRNSNGSTDLGLWQINSIHKIPRAELLDPIGNAKAAYRISAGGLNWRPWAVWWSDPFDSGFGHGRVGDYMSAATDAAAVVLDASTVGWDEFLVGGPVGDAVDATAGALAAVGRFLGALLQASTWVRVAEVIGGGVLAFYGIKLLSRELGGPEIRLPGGGR